MWDFSLVGGEFTDDLMGSTTIDLEDRIFNQRWIGYDPKPIEWRPIHHPDCNHPRGQLELWARQLV